jgi:uncharacterized protein YjiK
MEMKKILLFASVLFFGFIPDKYPTLKPYKSHRLQMHEPSEICIADENHFFILGDKAFLYETDGEGIITKTSSTKAYDIEGACVVDDKLYVSDESLRQILVFDKSSMKLLQTKQLQYNGARNLGFESITYNPATKHFLLATEKAPQLFFEYDENFQNINEFAVPEIKEVSSLTFHGGYVYMLSDEMHEVFKVDSKDYSVQAAWKIPVINPEGICFNNSGDMIIVSDDMGKIFYFKNFDKQ